VESAIVFDRLQFAFTVMFHYLFPQLTMGLAPLIFYFRWRAMRAPDGHFERAARFWTKLFAVNFGFGVVTGIPLEFQFGTNELGQVLKLRRRRDRPAAGDGRRLRFLP
jgi:cytochrome d ubiquinol oxidase subunit I